MAKSIPWHPFSRPTVTRQPPERPARTLEAVAPLHPAAGVRQIGRELPAGVVPGRDQGQFPQPRRRQ